MKMNNRLLSLILVVVMILGMFPLSAIATAEDHSHEVPHIEDCSAECAVEGCTCTCHVPAHIEGCSAECAVEGCACTCHQVMIVNDDPTRACDKCDGIYAEDGVTVVHNSTCPTRCSCTPVDGVHVAPCEFASKEVPPCEKCNAVKNADGTIKHETTCEKVQYVPTCNGKLPCSVEGCTNTHCTGDAATCPIAECECKKPLCDKCEATKGENGAIVHKDNCLSKCKCEAVVEGVHSNWECPFYVEPVKTLSEKLLEINNLSDLLIGALEDEMALMELTLEEINALRARAEELYAKIENPSTTDTMDRDDFLALMEVLPNYRAENACPDCGMIGEHAEDCPWMQMRALPTGTKITSSSTKLTSGNYYLEDNVTLSTGKYLHIPSGANVTIDMQQFVLAGNAESLIRVDGTLTIKGQSTGGHGGYVMNGRWYWRGSNPVPEGGTTYNIAGAVILNKGTGNGILVTGTCNIEYATIAGCSSSHGPAIAVSSTGVLNMTGGKVEYNVATKVGGPIYGEPSHNNNGSKMTISNVTVRNNTSAGSGGGISAYILDISNSKISDNTAASLGGGIYVTDASDSKKAGSLTVKTCTISNNTAERGGAIAVSKSVSTRNITVNLSDGTKIENNTATRHGGGIYDGELNITGTSTNKILISGNAAPMYGGGIYSSNPVTITYGDIKENYAGISGGGIHSRANLIITDTAITDNRAMTTETSSDGINDKVDQGRGGGIWVQGDGVVSTLTRVDISKNVCMYYGGGVQVCSGASLELISGSINENQCILKGAAGVHVTADATFIMTGGEISKNISRSVGGGIHSSYTCTLKLNGGSITDNIAYGRGAGVHVNTGGNLVLNGTYIANNKAYTGTNLIRAVVNEDLKTWSNVESDGSTVDGYGGGVHIDSGTCTLEGSVITGNYAEYGGGGISLVMLNSANANTLDKFDQNKVVALTINSGSISENKTDGYGGGIYLMRNRLSQVELNATGKSEQVEGGYYLDGIPNITINGGSVTGNEAAQNGGGAYQEGSTMFVMAGGELSGNRAKNGAGVFIDEKKLQESPDGMAEINAGTITGNIANADGGGLYVNGPVTMTGGAISSNTATGNGGAAYVAGGNVMIEHGNLDKNKAVQGGAVYMSGNASTTLTMQSGTMNENEATDDGGAIYATSGILYIGLEGCKAEQAAVSCTHHTALGAGRHHPKINNNKAGDTGGGISIANEGSVYFYCGEAKENKALYKGVGMNVFMNGGNFYLHDGADIGLARDPDLVIVGGQLHNECVQRTYIDLYYYMSNDSSEEAMHGLAELNEIMNLPDGEYFWKAPEGYVFLGWTAQGAVDGTYVRNKEQYLPSGVPIEVLDNTSTGDDNTAMYTNRAFDGTADNKIHLYALWAPITSKITYVDCMDGTKANTASDPDNPATYSFNRDSNIISIYPIKKPGYDLVGWYISQDKDKNANWNNTLTDTTYEPTAATRSTETHFGHYEELRTEDGKLDRNGVLSLEVGNTNFGDITLIAHYVPAFTTLIIEKSGANMTADVNQSFVFHISGDPADDEIANVEMDVVITGNESATIEHLPVGTYTVTEVSDWSWRYGTGSYAISSVKTAAIADGDGFITDKFQAMDAEDDYTVTFSNTRTESKWLDGDSICRNWFNGTNFVRK